MAGHSAFPNAKDRQRLAQHFGFVEENVAEAPTDDHPKQRAARDEVADTFRGQICISAFGQPEEQEITADKCKHIGQTVPSRPDVVVNSKDNRIEIVQIIREHSADCP